MICRVRRGVSGLSEYLLNGKKQNSKYLRLEKDVVRPLIGDFTLFQETEKYLVKEKNWKENYMHITIGFSDSDWAKIELLETQEDKDSLLRAILNDYINHHFSSYKDEELIYYGELHYAKLKFDEDGKKRFNHCHLGISFLNPISDTKLRNLFAVNSFYDDVMARKTNFKYGFEQTKRKEIRVKNFDSQIGRDRKSWIELLDELNDREELIYFLENQMKFVEEIDYKVVNTTKNNYIKLINKSFKNEKNGTKKLQDINLQGRGFERFVDINSSEINHKNLEDMNQVELEEILSKCYEKRECDISKRRSAMTSQTLQKMYEQDEQLKKTFEKKYSQKDKKVEISSLKNLSFQQKIFYKQYQSIIEDKLQGYYVKVDDLKNITTFENRAKNIKITDFGDEIESEAINPNNQEKVKLMLEIAVAKGWDILNLEITGSDKFQIEVKKQILERIEESSKKDKFEITRSISYIDNLILDNQSKIIENEKVNDIEFIKKHLPSKVVLEFAKQKYNINFDEFDAVEDNKIKNKTNRQKPKSVIDFFTKEIGISLKEAIEISNELLKDVEIIDSDTHTENVFENSNESNKEVEVVVEDVSVVYEITKTKSKRKNSDKKFK
ncbi:hypothetical protein NG767_07295 [Aliarcobacter cryaerophilus]|uniref:LPD7 domain-containing protein n=1 Tax=Aliarcobacter cryaerophilus TaxID=28198 RepID=UPI003DA20C7C